MASKIDIACQWAIDICNDDTHGYDNIDRHGPDYDCASLVQDAWRQAGVNIMASGTASFHTHCLKVGFIDVSDKVNLKTGEGTRKGDIWINPRDHVAMVIDNEKNFAEAHYNENFESNGGQPGDQTGYELSITPWHDNDPYWKLVMRWPTLTADKSTVISSNAFLSFDEMQANAIYIAAYFIDKGWTLNAIAGMLGNIQHESTMNPGIWENLDEGNTDRGFGLTQWTPATKLIDWANSRGLDYRDIDTQLERIYFEYTNGEQFYPSSSYSETFAEFASSSLDPYYLACVFAWNYERSWTVLYGTEAEKEALRQKRGNSAIEWFNLLAEMDFSAWPIKKKGLSKLLLYAVGSE